MDLRLATVQLATWTQVAIPIQGQPTMALSPTIEDA